MTALSTAIVKEREEIVKILLSHPNIDVNMTYILKINIFKWNSLLVFLIVFIIVNFESNSKIVLFYAIPKKRIIFIYQHYILQYLKTT